MNVSMDAPCLFDGSTSISNRVSIPAAVHFEKSLRRLLLLWEERSHKSMARFLARTVNLTNPRHRLSLAVTHVTAGSSAKKR